MYEKISDEPIRKKKIAKLKSKILLEIESNLNKYRNAITQDTKDEDFEYFIKESFVLLKLKEYITKEYSFMNYSQMNFRNDLAIYYISDEKLNIWLQEDYSFVNNFLIKARDRDYTVFFILNDKYLGSDFTSICDVVKYKNKDSNK